MLLKGLEALTSQHVCVCQLGAELGALAISHLEEVTDQGIAAMATARTAAVLLPTTAYILRYITSDTHTHFLLYLISKAVFVHARVCVQAAAAPSQGHAGRRRHRRPRQ